jgi:hypothetical protein
VSTQRPFFVRPTLAPLRVHRGEVIVQATVHQHMPFMIDNSCFSRRRVSYGSPHHACLAGLQPRAPSEGSCSHAACRLTLFSQVR